MEEEEDDMAWYCSGSCPSVCWRIRCEPNQYHSCILHSGKKKSRNIIGYLGKCSKAEWFFLSISSSVSEV
ncbi:hypothetical protein GQ55_7G248600 [Panicum hallii var. hallii]|uniref:Uncharacterized protein n=1 Tax=Panicum hallii var. hallii TaxID=1504633 RepID=A0A2T7CYS1_9POAL|nr:hypothetical protein GQ55_7G248600 [Panicum hallii var. hallii]